MAEVAWRGPVDAQQRQQKERHAGDVEEIAEQPGVEQEGGAEDRNVDGTENLDPGQEAIEPLAESGWLLCGVVSIAVGQR
jgi:hypothetical protein